MTPKKQKQQQYYKKGDVVPINFEPLSSIHTQLRINYYFMDDENLPICFPPTTTSSKNNDTQLPGEDYDYEDIITNHGYSSSSTSSSSIFSILDYPIYESNFNIKMLEDVYQKEICTTTATTLSNIELIENWINNGYHHRWYIDNNLPIAALGMNIHTQQLQKRYSGGFPIGFSSTNKQPPTVYYVFNHFNLYVDYHDNRDGTYSIVGAAVEPLNILLLPDENNENSSISSSSNQQQQQQQQQQHLQRIDITKNQVLSPSQNIKYTYDVIWRPSDVNWDQRLDIYLTEDRLVPSQVHWYSITNSIVVVLFLMSFIFVILWRNVRNDYYTSSSSSSSLAVVSEVEMMKNNNNNNDEEEGGSSSSSSSKVKQQQNVNNVVNRVENYDDNDDHNHHHHTDRIQELEEKGWKLISTKIFDPNQTTNRNWLIACCGNGIQLLLATFITILALAFRFIRWIDNGPIFNIFLISYIICSIGNGFTIEHLLQSFKIQQQQQMIRTTIILSLTVFPFLSLIVTILINHVASINSHVTAIQFSTIIEYGLFIWAWLVILTSLGGMLAQQKKKGLLITSNNNNNMLLLSIKTASPPETFLLGILFHRRSFKQLKIQSKICTILVALLLNVITMALLLLWCIKRFMVQKKWWSPNYGNFYVVAIGSILSLGCIYVEAFFLMTGGWMQQYYDVFGYLLIVFILEIITCCQVSILTAYYQLCWNDGTFSWWWQFISSGSVGILLFVYSSLWYTSIETSGSYAPIVYFGGMMMVSIALFLAMGSAGIISSILFVNLVLRRVQQKSSQEETSVPLV